VGRAEIVRSPDGERWRVRRRWLDHPVPKLRRAMEDRRGELAAEGGIEMLFSDSSVGAGIALAVGLAVVVFVVLPLIGLALELIILVAFVGLGLIGRLLFRRPWMIEAVNLDHPQRSAEFGIGRVGQGGRPAVGGNSGFRHPDGAALDARPGFIAALSGDGATNWPASQ
jgi:hypothetical protein